MSYSTLISVSEFASCIGKSGWLAIDCRFDLIDPAAGRQRYHEAHIPGALYAHLDDDLAGPVIPGVTGRHPLPDPDTFTRTLSRWGIDQDVQVVVYDDGGGMIASRLWWMLRWLGHDKVAVLDGGWKQWCQHELPYTNNVTTRAPLNFIPHLQQTLEAKVEEVEAGLANGSITLLDARSSDRYRGENETMDSKAGHIPGAISAPFMDNLGPEGCFLTPSQLETRYRDLLQAHQACEAVVYCGSGVTATHNILAMEHAGMKGARLYAGSWSHWITDPSRPIACGQTAASTEELI